MFVIFSIQFTKSFLEINSNITNPFSCLWKYSILYGVQLRMDILAENKGTYKQKPTYMNVQEPCKGQRDWITEHEQQQTQNQTTQREIDPDYPWTMDKVGDNKA